MTSPQPSPAERELLSGRGTRRAEEQGAVPLYKQVIQNAGTKNGYAKNAAFVNIFTVFIPLQGLER
ncbi:MAG: hypothetical protein JNL32_05135 [Candidatus Kapabacteria bacterium]|nr:hypothetical protein [Candidatus Kapabacteria bacterium]